MIGNCSKYPEIMNENTSFKMFVISIQTNKFNYR